MRICDGEFDAPDLGNPDYSRLNINFFAVKDGASLTLRKDLKTLSFQLVDERSEVVVEFPSLGAALGAGQAIVLGVRGIVGEDVVCDHATARKSFCPTARGLAEGA